MVAMAGLEPATFRFLVGILCQLGYIAMVKMVEETGLAPATHCLQGRVAPMEHVLPVRWYFRQGLNL